MIRTCPAVALVTLALMYATPAAAQDLMPVCRGGADAQVSLGPTFNSAPSLKERIGLKSEVSVCLTGTNDVFSGGWHGLAVAGRALIVGDSVNTPDVSEMRATALVGFSMFKVTDVVIDTSAMPTPGGLIQSWGWLEFGGTAAYEESADRSERDITAGGVVRYGHERKAWAPTVAFSYEFVRPIQSAERLALGLDEEDPHTRFSTDVYWNLPLRFVSTTFENFSIGADVSYFRANGLDAALVATDDDWASGTLGAGTIRWDGDVGLLGRLSLTSAYARYAAGHQATDAVDRDGLRVGVDITFKAGSAR